MLIATFVGRITSTADLMNVTRHDGTKTVKIDIPIACDTGHANQDTSFTSLEVWGEQAKACARNLEIGQVLSGSGDQSNERYTRKQGEHAGSTNVAPKIVRLSVLTFGAKARSKPEHSDPMTPNWYNRNRSSVTVAVPDEDAPVDPGNEIEAPRVTVASPDGDSDNDSDEEAAASSEEEKFG